MNGRLQVCKVPKILILECCESYTMSCFLLGLGHSFKGTIVSLSFIWFIDQSKQNGGDKADMTVYVVSATGIRFSFLDHD